MQGFTLNFKKIKLRNEEWINKTILQFFAKFHKINLQFYMKTLAKINMAPKVMSSLENDFYKSLDRVNFKEAKKFLLLLNNTQEYIFQNDMSFGRGESMKNNVFIKAVLLCLYFMEVI